MLEDVSVKAIGACFGLSAFVIAILVGMLVNNPLDAIILRAIAALFGGYIVGLIVGSLATKTINQSIIKAAEAAKAAHDKAHQQAHAHAPAAHATPPSKAAA